MGDDILRDDSFGVPTDFDPFGTQQTVTPNLGSYKTAGTEKLLVVVFVIDCSQTMEGERIQAVNAALNEVKYKLQEVKKDNNLDLRIAIMSFTSGVRWELDLTDIDEVTLENLRTRPGLTQYGAAFHELNKVLTKDRFMKHVGKKAAPAIMFLTDGEPTDDYERDLDDLLKNGWFANASRSAVLLGDAIYNDAAKQAVSRFVGDSEDIVGAENSTEIIDRIKIATMHTVAGDPMDKNGNGMGVSEGNPTPATDPVIDPFPTTDPVTDPFPTTDPVVDPFPATDPVVDPFPTTDPVIDPFPTEEPIDDPFPTGPFYQDPDMPDSPDEPQDDPFGGDPFGGDPFGGTL